METLFSARRSSFFDKMQDGVAIFKGGRELIRNGDVNYQFRQDSDFYFLTGLEEPEALAVFIKQGDLRRFILFVSPSDPEQEVWTGGKVGLIGATKVFGADEAYPVSEFFQRIPEILNNQYRLYMEFGKEPIFEKKVFLAIENLKKEGRKNRCGPWEIIDPRTILWEMRLIKTPKEVEALERACDVTAKGIIAAMKAVVPGMTERELKAVVEFEFQRRGARRLGFETICARGINATVLHYTKCDDTIHEGDLVLVDAGCEIDYMSGDITRTFPANGKFSKIQEQVYRCVLEANKAAILKVKPGVTYQEVHMTALRVLVEGLKRLKILKGNIDKLIEQEKYTPYFMHRIGHYLGMDVHDVGPYYESGQSIVLKEGMVLTIEPGLYLGNSPRIPEHLRGIGIRIEDDILVTENKARVLTENVPKEPEEIEETMKGSWWKEVAPVSVRQRSVV